uniref:Uncharacterized protein n=1 Tax=Arundo donax TaxID=35708 RepID=A0A0A8Z3Q9_ARUDO
MYTLVEGY